MPLEPGKQNIGHNVSEMEANGHSKAQSVAAALHTAYDAQQPNSFGGLGFAYGSAPGYDTWSLILNQP
jgi:hypothetical protein